jgi:hypothetical protein
MANSFGTETPPSPSPGSGNALTSGAPTAPANGVMAGGPPGMAPGSQSAPQAQPAPPTHAQTVTALRHFDAVRKELEILADDPALGKSNMKSKIIDGVTRLVAERFMKPSDAVIELSKVPTEPLLQMKWVKTMYQQTRQAENGILDHYGMTNPNMGTVADHHAMTGALNDRYEHQDHLDALKANYGPAQNG